MQAQQQNCWTGLFFGPEQNPLDLNNCLPRAIEAALKRSDYNRDSPFPSPRSQRKYVISEYKALAAGQRQNLFEIPWKDYGQSVGDYIMTCVEEDPLQYAMRLECGEPMDVYFDGYLLLAWLAPGVGLSVRAIVAYFGGQCGTLLCPVSR